jgi:DNA-binding response OmpR family regulator
VVATKILIVDDDVEIRELLGEELRDLGHESIYAADGLQALSLMRREQPDLMLLDLRLPGGDGFSVLEWLRIIPDVASIPVIVFSGMRSPQAEERALMLGAREFVQKSFRGNDLVEAIARALNRRAPPPLRLSKPDPVPAAESALNASSPTPMPALRVAPSLDG